MLFPARTGATGWLVSIVGACLLGTAGCGDGDNRSQSSTPESALAALAAAINDSDDTAIDGLLCAAAKEKGHTISEARSALAEYDPRLQSLTYRAEAGAISGRTDTTADGALKITVEGMPDDLSVQAQQAVDASEIPRPMNQMTPDGTIHLVLEAGTWVACVR